MFGQIATVEICTGSKKINGRYALGLCCILLQCFVWITASVLTQYMFAETPLESPFLMTYVGATLLIFMLPGHMLMERWSKYGGPHNCFGIEPNDSFADDIANASGYDILEIVASRSRSLASSKKQWNHKKHALAALLYVRWDDEWMHRRFWWFCWIVTHRCLLYNNIYKFCYVF